MMRSAVSASRSSIRGMNPQVHDLPSTAIGPVASYPGHSGSCSPKERMNRRRSEMSGSSGSAG